MIPIIKYLIYIADDDKNICNILKTQLESEGYEVKSFYDGKQLLQEFKKQPSNLIITDIMMPILSGYELCREIRKLSDIPIIMISAKDEEIDKILGIELGSDDYISKPFSLREVTIKVRNMLRRVNVTSKVKTEEDILIIKDMKIITKPMNKLVDTTKKIASKDFDSKINLNTKDEFEVLANALNDMSDKLKKKDIHQKKFYEQISHELKTPVTVISGYAQGVKNNIFEGQDKYLDIIVSECDNLKNELENIIYLSKLDTVNEFYNFKEESLNKLIEMALDKVESIVILNEIDIEYNPKR